MIDVVLVKLGGSLLTDKRRPETARPEVIARLATEVARALPALAERGERLVLGHGSGSFGHVAAADSRIHQGLRSAEQLASVALTQARAAELHRLLTAALLDAGVPAFSIAPSSAAVAAGRRLVAFTVEPIARALAVGLVPVTYGDVVTDREQGVAIASTEAVFTALARGLPEHGARVVKALWLGETAGIYDRAGETIPEISPSAATAARAAAGSAAGTDVTGGMAHRLETALALGRSGIPSWILDGRVPGLLQRALAGAEASGTRVAAEASGAP